LAEPGRICDGLLSWQAVNPRRAATTAASSLREGIRTYLR
jgi:hypothetical protein